MENVSYNVEPYADIEDIMVFEIVDLLAVTNHIKAYQEHDVNGVAIILVVYLEIKDEDVKVNVEKVTVVVCLI